VLEYVTGTVKGIREKQVIIDFNGMGVSLLSPSSTKLEVDSLVTLFTYLHWNAEQGPSLFGFKTEFERKVFLLIIECPKVGPALGLAILNHFSAAQFLEVVSTQDEKRLSQVSGIGSKKAEQIIVQLKHKVQKLIVSGENVTENQTAFIQWQNVNDVLTSLNYSKAEIANVMQFLTAQPTIQNHTLDQLLRTALAYLSKQSLSL